MKLHKTEGVLGGLFYIDAEGMTITIKNCVIEDIKNSANG